MGMKHNRCTETMKILTSRLESYTYKYMYIYNVRPGLHFLHSDLDHSLLLIILRFKLSTRKCCCVQEHVSRSKRNIVDMSKCANYTPKCKSSLHACILYYNFS